MNHSARPILQSLGGAYLLYLSYQLLKGLTGNIETDMPRWVAILAIVAFAAIGILFLLNAWRIWKNEKTDQDQHPVELENESSESAPEKSDSPD